MTEAARRSQFARRRPRERSRLLGCGGRAWTASRSWRSLAWAPWAWAAASPAPPGCPVRAPCCPACGSSTDRSALALFLAAALASVARGGRLRWPAALDRPCARARPGLRLPGPGRASGTRAGLRVSGDEPHYLLMAQSLWHEGTSTCATTSSGEDYREYTPGPVAPHYGAPRRDGRPFPAHSPGLPLLLAPVYAIGGPPARVSLLLALCGACSRARSRLAGGAPGGRCRAARLAWAAALGPPVFFYAFHVYTEVPVGAGARGGAAAPDAARAALERPRRGARLACPALAARQDDAGRGRPGGRSALVRLRGRALRGPSGVVLAAAGAAFLAGTTYVFGRPTPVRDLRRHAGRVREGSPLARGGRACSSTAPSACCRTRPSSCWPSGCAPPRADWRDGRALLAVLGCLVGPGAGAVLADVVGRTVSAGALPGAGGGRAGDGAGARGARGGRARAWPRWRGRPARGRAAR